MEQTLRFRERVEEIYQEESRPVLATLIRLVRDFDLAEEALSEAFAAAVERWPVEGLPENPRAWLVSAGRFKAIDTMRRRARFDAALAALATEMDAAPAESANEDVADDRLRLIFICCHPDLAPEAQVAITLREVCGLTTEEIARAFLTAPPTIAQRIVRAKAKIHDDHIPYQLPDSTELGPRLEAVLRVIYLVYNEGYRASSGVTLLRHDLSGEAIRLGRLVAELLPEPEVQGLLALMLLNESRRAARASSAGDIILLAEQDRSLWDRDRIAEGAALVEQALRSRRFGSYTLQAAIAAVHAEASSVDETDWPQIVGLYDLLLQPSPNPVIELNRAVAVSMRDGPAPGLALIDALFARGELLAYQPAHASRADCLRRLGLLPQAREAYERALSLTAPEPERRFLERRLQELPPG